MSACFNYSSCESDLISHNIQVLTMLVDYENLQMRDWCQLGIKFRSDLLGSKIKCKQINLSI